LIKLNVKKLKNKEMMRMYTKGEWKVESGQVIDERGEIVARAYRDTECRIPPTERDCNMHLIASAPDLYEACKELLKKYRLYRPQIFGTDALECQARQALAKAEGTK